MLDTFVKRGHRWHSIGLVAVPPAVSATVAAPLLGAAPAAHSTASTAPTAAEAASNLGETLHGYPLIPAGQTTYQRDLVSLVASLPDDLGVGVLYWSNNSASTLGWFAPPDGEAQPVVFSYDIG